MATVAALCTSAACGGRPDPEPTPDARVARSRALLELQVTRDGTPGCTAAVGERGVPLWQDARGLADVATGRPLDPATTTFELASVSKQFTALALLLLAGSGRLALDDPVARHVDGLPDWGERVTLAQLMHHQGGIPDYFPVRRGGDPTAVLSRRAVLREISGFRRLDFEPGSSWAYSNSGYVLLAEVVEQVSGQTYPEFLASEVFGPAGVAMRASSGAAAPGMATPYAQAAGGFEPGGWGFYAMGAVGVRATTADLLRWSDDYRTGRVGGPELLEDQWDDAPTTPLESARYGAGMFRLTDGTLFNDGDFGNFRTGFLVSPDRQRSVVVLCNRRAGIDPYAFARSLARVWDFR